MRCLSTNSGSFRLYAVAIIALATIFCGRACAEDIGQKNNTRYPLRQSDYNRIIAKLDKVLKTAPLSTLLDEATIPTKQSDDLESTKWYIDSFNITDDERWEPTGISSSSDAGLNVPLLKDEQNVLVISWKDTAVKSLGVRVTFVRRGAAYRPSEGRVYQHALLVLPTLIEKDTPSFSTIPGKDVGGIVWRGNWLYVADAKEGLRVFDLRHMFLVDDAKDTVGKSGDKYFGGGHKYVIPQARVYEPNLSKGASLIMHSVSLDRNTSVPSIMVGEYIPGEEKGKENSTFCRYPLDEETNLLKTNSSGLAVPYWSWVTNVKYVKGFVFAKGGFFIVRGSRTLERAKPYERGAILFWKPGAWASEHNDMLPANAQAITYKPGHDTLWVVGGKGGTTFVLGLNSQRSDVLPESIFKDEYREGNDSEATPGGNGSAPPEDEDLNRAKGGSSKKLTKAQSAGIGIGVVVAVAIAICIFFLVRRSKTKQHSANDAPQNPQAQTVNSFHSNNSHNSTTPYYKPELDGQAVYRELHEHSIDTGSSSPSGLNRVHTIPRRPVPGSSPTAELPSPAAELPIQSAPRAELPSPGSMEYPRHELGGNEKARRTKYESID